MSSIQRVSEERASVRRCLDVVVRNGVLRSATVSVGKQLRYHG